MKRLIALGLVAVGLTACGTSEATTASDVSRDREGPRTQGTARLEMAEGPRHEMGTLGEGCEQGKAPRIDPPDASWNTETITAFEDSSGETIFLPRGGVRVRYPRHWDRASENVFEVNHSGDAADAGSTEVGVIYMATVPTPAGMSPWDVRIQAMEEALSLEAAEATPLSGGRCLVEGQRYAGPAAVLLFPLGGDDTLIARAEFIYLSDWEREFDEVPRAERDVALQILNSLELVEPPSIPAI